MYGKSFVYNGKSSDEFDLCIAGFQTMDIPLGLKRTTDISGLNKYRHKINMYGINYDAVLGFTMQLMRDPCKYESHDDLKFSREELREVAAWLTSPISPRLFHMTNYDDDESPEYDYMGVFTNIELADNSDYVLQLTFECNTPYALSPEVTVSSDEGSITVENPSDEYEDYVYPIITITPTQSGSHTITITNVTDDEQSITLLNMKNQDVVIIDCQKLTIKNESGSLISFDNVDIEGLDYIYWPRLLHGTNEITVSNEAEIEIKFRYPVKVGAY